MRQLALFETASGRRRFAGVLLLAIVACFVCVGVVAGTQSGPPLAPPESQREVEIVETRYSDGSLLPIGLTRQVHNLELRVSAIECAIATPVAATVPISKSRGSAISPPQANGSVYRERVVRPITAVRGGKWLLGDLFPRLRDRHERKLDEAAERAAVESYSQE
jgi:hypothetical protein